MNARDTYGERGGPAPSWHQVWCANRATDGITAGSSQVTWLTPDRAECCFRRASDLLPHPQGGIPVDATAGLDGERLPDPEPAPYISHTVRDQSADKPAASASSSLSSGR